MNHDRLPGELEALQRELTERDRPCPSANLRDRVLGNTRAQVRRDRRRSGWIFAGQAAAVALVWINLSLSVTRSTNLGITLGETPPSVDVLARQVQEILPDISQREAHRQALLLQASWNLTAQPNFSTCSITSSELHESLDDLFSNGG